MTCVSRGETADYIVNFCYSIEGVEFFAKCGVKVDLHLTMKKLITYLSILSFLLTQECFAQWPGDVKPIAGKTTFASRREARVEERQKKKDIKRQKKLEVKAQRNAVNRFVYKKQTRRGKSGPKKTVKRR